MAEIYFKVNPEQEEVSVSEEQIVKVDLTREACNGRANTQLLEKLEKITGERPGILSGHSSSRKKLVFDQKEDEIRQKIREYAKK